MTKYAKLNIGDNNAMKDKYYKYICKYTPWIKHWYNARTRCVNKNSTNWKSYGCRGIKCLLTKEEIKILWFRDKAYLMKHPTIDRIHNDGDYTFKNCRFLEMKYNTIKRNINYGIPILQYDLNKKFIKEWKSAKEVNKILGIHQATISANLKNRLKTAKGFIWRYKNEK